MCAVLSFRICFICIIGGGGCFVGSDGGGFLRAGPREMSELFTIPAKRFPALYDDCHGCVFICYRMGYCIEPSPI